MSVRIVVINGHPDARPERFCSALTDAYVVGAQAAGHQVRRIDVGALTFPTLRTIDEFIHIAAPPVLQDAQEAIRWATHVVIIHPLWLGGQPALLRAFLEQVFRYGFALTAPGAGQVGGLLKGRSARLIVTMGMPAVVFRVVFGAWGVRAFERGVLWLCGFRPIRRTVLGAVETATRERRAAYLDHVRRLGARAA